MARNNFDRAVNVIFRHEGGYADHPLDPGGATNHGVTRRTLAQARGRPVSKAEVMALTRTEAALIYRARYWEPIRAEELPAGVDLAVFDAAVNSGPRQAALWLQRTLGVAADGVIGPLTLAAAGKADARAVIVAYGRLRLAFLTRLAAWPTFGRGWSRRVRETEAAALAMARPRLPPALPGAPAAQPQPSQSLPNPKPETSPMTDSKSLLASKTLWANLVGLAALGLGAFGFDAGGLDAARLGEAIPQAIAALSFIASTVFRITATRRLE